MGYGPKGQWAPVARAKPLHRLRLADWSRPNGGPSPTQLAWQRGRSPLSDSAAAIEYRERLKQGSESSYVPEAYLRMIQPAFQSVRTMSLRSLGAGIHCASNRPATQAVGRSPGCAPDG